MTTSIKDQGRTCGASYAFAIIDALEAAQAKERGVDALQLSEQQIIDCTFNSVYRNFGCMGGSLERTIEYVQSKPILEEKYYPYVAAQNNICDDEK